MSSEASASPESREPEPVRTPLFALHGELGAKLVAFAGYALPVRYPAGIIAEHKHTRSQASLFDVSHMGQIDLSGPDAGAALESLVPADLIALPEGWLRYTMLTNEAGGIRDDLMVANLGTRWILVVNAAGKDADAKLVAEGLAQVCETTLRDDRALLALQGPAAVTVMARHAPGATRLSFLGVAQLTIADVPALVSRSGYTGEDGFEISLAADDADRVARVLLAEPEVEPAGLGARDSLRLEAGLCLYGHDIDESTTPVEAGLAWTIGMRRRAEGGFPGAEAICDQLANGPSRQRVGIRPEGRAPAREHTTVLDVAGKPVGVITSGGVGPSLDAPIAMGYVATQAAKPGTALQLVVRDRPRLAAVVTLPFVPHHYHQSVSH